MTLAWEIRFFCKYLCPQGVLEGAIPLSMVDAGIRAALGKLFTWKMIILVAVVVLSVLFYRPFCKWVCPLGAFYGLMNKVSLLGVQVDQCKCVSCGKCAKACRMDVDDARRMRGGVYSVRKMHKRLPADAEFRYGVSLPNRKEGNRLKRFWL